MSSTTGNQSSLSGGQIERKAITKIQPWEKQSGLGITFIWIGSVISVPMLMAGALLASGLTLGMTLLVTLIAFAVQVFIMTLNGMQASDTGYPLTVILGKAFGEKGSRFIMSSLILVVQALHFAIQTAVCGKAFSVLMGTFGVPIPAWISIIFWGAIMLVTAVYGFGWMKVLNYLSVPFLVFICLYGAFLVIQKSSLQAVLSYQPEVEMGFISGLAVMIGVFALGTLIVADITRYSKSRKSTILSSIFGIIPAVLFMTATGAIMSIGAGNADISTLFVDLGLPVLGVITLILATWTTNTTNAYISGIALTRVLAFPDYKRARLTVIVGAVGIFIALFNIDVAFQGIMDMLSTLIPPIAGILVADYWILGKGKPENWGIIPGFNFVGLLSWILGIGVGLIPFFSPAFNSIVVAFIIYIILYKVFDEKIAKPVDPAKFVGE